MNKTLIALLLAGISGNALSVDSEYDADLKILTIPTIKIGNDYAYETKLKLNSAGSFDVIGSIDLSPATSERVYPECTADHITMGRYRQIKEGMTLKQVNSFVGCKGRFYGASGSVMVYRWGGGSRSYVKSLISVTFSDDVVSPVGATYIP